MLITMYRRARAESLRIAVGMALAALTACGGGGDKSPPRWTMVFTPGMLEAASYEGESVTVTFTGINSVAASNVSIDVTSSDGVITSNATSSEQADQRSFVFTVEVSPDLSPGIYSGLLDLRVCNGADCHDPRWPSWQLPYRFTVHPATNLTPLSHLGSVGAWSTYQGNAAHDGHVDATLEPKTFLRRFTGPSTRFGAVAQDGRVFIVSRDDARHWRLSALRESDGGEAWHYDLPGGTTTNVNPPAVSAGRVFLASTDVADDSSYFWTFDAATGHVLAKTAITSQGEEYLPPTVFNDAVFSTSGAYGGMSRFDAATGAAQWSIGLEQFHQWTPAVDGQSLYTYLGGKLRVIDPATGDLKYEIIDPGSVGGGSELGSPVLDGHARVFAVDSQSRLVAFSLAEKNVLWSEWNPGFYTDIAVADGMLYDVRGTTLEARSTATGAVQWTWAMPEWASNDRIQVIVANNLAFVAGVERTYAIDLATHQQLWAYPVAGSMSISDNGVLYIAQRGGGKLVAINLH